MADASKTGTSLVAPNTGRGLYASLPKGWESMTEDEFVRAFEPTAREMVSRLQARKAAKAE
ncbi:MAG: hypothetical protein ACR2F6_08780 [Mycobacteriales bacterium]